MTGSADSRTVRPFRDSDREAWDRYVFACPQATFFHRIGWRDIYTGVFRHKTHYLLAERAGRIVGVLPMVELRSMLFGHSLVSLPFAVYGGVAVDDPQAAAALHAAAAELGARSGFSTSNCATANASCPTGRSRIST